MLFSPQVRACGAPQGLPGDLRGAHPPIHAAGIAGEAAVAAAAFLSLFLPHLLLHCGEIACFVVLVLLVGVHIDCCYHCCCCYRFAA